MGNGKSSPLKIRLFRVPNDPLFLLRLPSFGVVSGFFVPMDSRGGTSPSQAPSEPPTCAMFTFQLIKTVSHGTDLGYDGDRSACFR